VKKILIFYNIFKTNILDLWRFLKKSSTFSEITEWKNLEILEYFEILKKNLDSFSFCKVYFVYKIWEIF